jgi:hypothetical protein
MNRIPCAAYITVLTDTSEMKNWLSGNQTITCVSQKSNVTSNKIKSEKEKNPFSMFHGAIINGNTINVHIVTGSNKRKKHV